MKAFNKIMIFCLILFVGLTAVSAADILDDDASISTVETPQVDQTNEESFVQEFVQETDNNEDEDTTPTRSSVTINSDVTINDQTTYDTYNGKDWIIQSGVTVTGSPDYALSDVSINVTGNQVTLKNLYITSQDISDYIINVTSVNNFRIDNSQLTITNINNIPTMGIYVKNVDTAIINGTTLTVNAPAQAQQWYNTTPDDWYSVLEVSGVYSDHSNNVKLENSTITITNTTENLYGSTMPAVTIRNNSNQISIKNNTISATGAQYVYGIMMNDLVNNVETKDNTITVNGIYYVAGIDASTASNSKTCKNTITATSQGATTYPNGYESLAYGIISDTYSSGNTGNHICQNTIDLSANVCYGIEMYKGMNNFICTNDVTATGNKVMGVALAHTTNTKIINNHIDITGTTTPHHYFYEEVTPENTGIILTNQSNTNTIKGNTIIVTAYGDTSVWGINLTNDTSNTVDNNYIKAIIYTDEEIAQNPLLQNKEGATAIAEGSDDYVFNYANIAVLEPCTCSCECGTNTEPIENNEEGSDNFSAMNKKSLKNDDEPGIIYINDDNYTEYTMATSTGSTGGLVVMFTHLDPNNHVIVNFTQPIEFIGFQGDEFKSVTINVAQCSNTSGIYRLRMSISNNLYAPNAILIDVSKKAINCTVAGIRLALGVSLTIENCTIINLNAPRAIFDSYVVVQNFKGSLKNCYVFFYIPSNNTYIIGQNAVVGVHEGTVENITPSNENCYLLTNSNYTEFFDENNIIKEAYADSTIYAVENITNPVIIDKKVTLSAVRGHTGYGSVKFIEGSDESIIEDSFINNLEINNAALINVHNNKLIGDNAQIKLVETSNSIIENNIINTTKDYTIVLDENSMDNTIKNNELIAAQYTGDKSVQNTAENTIEDNTPEYEEPAATPELKVDTTEFTIGEKTTIKAAIYLGDEIATDITGGKVVFKVNGKTLKDVNGKVIYAKLINGVATIEDYEIPNSWNKEGLTITAVYSGSSKCEALRSQETNITTTTTTPQLTSENTTATTGSTIQLKAKITAGNNPITNGKVVFKVNGKTVKDNNGKVIYATVDSNGETSVNYTIPENMKTKDYTITITYTSPNYGKLNTTSTLTITE